MNQKIILTLCQSGCCPTVEIKQDKVLIQDDYGGKVTLTPEQLKILVEKYPELDVD